MTQMIYKSKGVELTCDKLLEEMHNQWQIAGNKNRNEKDLDDEDMVVAATVNKDIEKKTKYLNPDKDKTYNHCKKKGHNEKKCWKKHPELIPDKVKAARRKQAEKKANPTAATAIAEDEIILNMIDLEKSSIELSFFDMNDAFNKIPIDENIVYLKTMFKESDDEESDDRSCDDEKSNDKRNDDPPILNLSVSAVVTATNLNNLMPVTIGDVTKTCWEHAGYKIPSWTKNLCTFGEAGIMKDGKKGKILDRGIIMMFVGYSEDHTVNAFRMYCPETSRILQTRDVILAGQDATYQARCCSYAAITNSGSSDQYQ
jgi:hypothetical protein